MAPETDGSSLKESTDKPNESAHVGEEVGDIFASPKGSVLIRMPFLFLDFRFMP